MTDQPDPLAALRALADQYAAKRAESLRNAKASTLDEARTALPGVAAGWAGAEFLLRHTLADLDNSRTTPDNPPASDDTRRRDLARNAVGTALNQHGEWLPLSVREAVADAVLAAADAVLDRRLNDARSQPVQGATDEAPDLRQQYAAEIRDEIYEYRERTMFWEECGGVTEEITRLAVRGAMTVRDTELERLRSALAALAEIARGYCPHCGRGDAAPTADQYLEQVRIAENADIILDRVRAIAVDLRDDPDARYWANLLDTALDTPEHP